MKISGYCGLIAAALTFGLASSAASAEGQFQQAAPTGPKNPAGTVVRYRISDWVSVSAVGVEHATQVTTITNQSTSTTCGVGVDLDSSNGNTACTLNNPVNLPAGQSVNICSRSLGFPIVDCQVLLTTCPGANLAGGSGKVWTTPACTNIAVSARTIYTNASDNTVQGISDAKLVKPAAGNIGD